MITILTTAIYMAIIRTMFIKTPIKMCVFLALIITLLFTKFYMELDYSWFRLTMHLLFIGGILIIFMIVSSVIPNEKEKTTSKKFLITITITFIRGVYANSNIAVRSLHTEIKMFIRRTTLLVLTLFVITTYFTAFLSFITKRATSLRSLETI